MPTGSCCTPCAFVMAINFWFLLELKNKKLRRRRKRIRYETTMEETLSETHYFQWAPPGSQYSAAVSVTRSDSIHTHMHTKKVNYEWQFTSSFSLSPAFEMVKLAPVVDFLHGKTLFIVRRYLSHEMCVRVTSLTMSMCTERKTFVNFKPRLIQLNMRPLVVHIRRKGRVFLATITMQRKWY